MRRPQPGPGQTTSWASSSRPQGPETLEVTTTDRGGDCLATAPPGHPPWARPSNTTIIAGFVGYHCGPAPCWCFLPMLWRILGGVVVKNPPAKQEMQVRSSVRKIPCKKKGNPLQYSCLEIPMDREAWQGTVHGITKSQTQQPHLILSSALLLVQQMFIELQLCVGLVPGGGDTAVNRQEECGLPAWS